MITYFVYNESAQERFSLNPVMKADRPTAARIGYAADFIFRIVNGTVEYQKNRYGDYDYFSEEDIVAMILAAVPM